MIKKFLGGLKHLFVRLLAVYAPASLLENLGKLRAALVYTKAVRSVPAYRQTVQDHLGCVPLFILPKNFPKLPVLDKGGYVKAHPPQSLTAGTLAAAFSIQASSGFSGKPTYWPKTVSEARRAASSFRLAWNEYLNPLDEATLLVVGFSLGTWASGTDLLRLATELAVHGGRKITNVAPGENVELTLDIIRDFKGHFQRILIFGNPVYLKRLIEEGQELGWKSLKVMLITGGEPTTEAWRSSLAEQIGVDLNQERMRIVNIYGACDFGVTTATESSFSIGIKHLALQDPHLAKAIFGRERNLPNLFQYQPLNHHIEQHGDNFLVTCWSQMPLLRYNIRDRGRVFSFNEMKRILIRCGYDFPKLCQEYLGRPFRVPFLFVDTRDDGTVSIGGANIYPGNIETALMEHPRLHAHIEHFYLQVVQNDRGDSRLAVELIVPDLKKRTPQWQKEFEQKASQAILTTLLRDNREYRVTWEHNPQISPSVRLLEPSQDGVHSLKRKYIKSDPGQVGAEEIAAGGLGE